MGFHFGLISEIPVGIGTASFIAVLVFLILFDSVLESLDYLEDDYRASYEMVQSVYKELMIMGVVSFTIIMLETTSALESHDAHTWILAIDLAHITLFFSTLCFALYSFYFIRSSITLSKKFRVMHVKETTEIIQEIEEYQNEYNSTNMSIWKRMKGYFIKYRLMEAAEFKLQFYIFRNAFKLPTDFDHSLYLELCTEKYLLKLLEYTKANRIVLMFLTIVNLFRVELMSMTQDSECLDFQNNLTVHRYLGEGGANAECVEMLLQTFVIAGYALVALNVFIVVLARVCEVRINKLDEKASSADMYLSYFKREWSADEDRKRLGNARNEVIRRLKEKIEATDIALYRNGQNSGQESVVDSEVITVEKQESSDIGLMIKVAKSESFENIMKSIELLQHHKGKRQRVKNDYLYEIGSRAAEAVMEATRHKSRQERHSILDDPRTAGNISHGVTPRQGLPRGSSHQSLREEHTTEEKIKAEAEEIEMKLKEQERGFANVFFGYRQLFIRSVDTTVMMNCIWLAFWATNYMMLTTESEHKSSWVTLLIFAVILLLPAMGFGLEFIFKLVAITKFDVDCFAKVVEMKEEVERLLQELKDKLEAQILDLQLSGDKRDNIQIITDLFNEIDVSGDGDISQAEFSELLTKLGLRFSVRKLNNIFNAIDADKQGTISLQEFKEVIFGVTNVQISISNEESMQVTAKLFVECDDNDDGDISKTEFSKFLTKLGLRFSLKKMNMIFDILDTDKNGSISLEEFQETIFSKTLSISNNK